MEGRRAGDLVIVTVMKDLWLEAAHKDICTADSVVVEGHDASLVKDLCLMIYIPPCVRKETRVGLRSQTFKTAPSEELSQDLTSVTSSSEVSVPKP